MVATSLAQQLTHRLNNQDVIEMVSLGFSDDVIIDKIQSTDGTDFDTSIAGLKSLWVSKVSDTVIRVMIHAGKGTPIPIDHVATSSVAPDSRLPIAPGLYTEINGRLTEMEPEIVNWQTGGVAKKELTLGIVKGDLNGKVIKPRSSNELRLPLQLQIKTMEGTSVTEYQLLRLHEKGNRREFRSVTGGVLHQSGGAQRDEVEFESEKIAERLWRVRLDHLQPGQYGFLVPGVASMSISASGKMYTFGVVANGVEAREPNKSDYVRAEKRSGSNGEASSEQFEDATIGATTDADPVVRRDGITLNQVMTGGPAEVAGIKPGDIILAFDDHYLYTPAELNVEVRRHKPGSRVAVRYRRYSTIYDASLVVGSSRR